jgi:hypothetical protein
MCQAFPAERGKGTDPSFDGSVGLTQGPAEVFENGFESRSHPQRQAMNVW